jgi:hypothetical protein
MRIKGYSDNYDETLTSRRQSEADGNDRSFSIRRSPFVQKQVQKFGFRK